MDNNHLSSQHLSRDSVSRYVRSPTELRELLETGTHFLDRFLIAAIKIYQPDSVRLLLEFGADPNERPKMNRGDTDRVDVTTQHDEDNEEGDVQDERDEDDCFPMEAAALMFPRNKSRREDQVKIMQMLLRAGVDLFADREEKSEVMSPVLRTGLRSGNEKQLEIRPSTTTVLHHLCSIGGLVSPILTNPHVASINPNRRDAQGQTLLHSVCRNPLGADAAIDAQSSDVSPYPPDECDLPDPFATSDARPSMFSFLISRGADMTASDKYGRTILHHVLAARDPFNRYRAPVIQKTLHHILSRHPELVNKPDGAGEAPLFYALKRVLDFPILYNYRFPIQRDESERRPAAAALALLSHGADSLGKDSHGNNPLHYLCALTSGSLLFAPAWMPGATATRTLFERLVDAGVDAKALNNAGICPVDMMREDDEGDMAELITDEYRALKKEVAPNNGADVDEARREVRRLFGLAGVNIE